MNIDKIRKFIKENKNKLLIFTYKGSRNQTDEFVGKIIEAYRMVFTIKVNDKTNRIKSYSYNDVLTNNLIIKEIAFKK